jgi:hypothetical protein
LPRHHLERILYFFYQILGKTHLLFCYFLVLTFKHFQIPSLFIWVESWGFSWGLKERDVGGSNGGGGGGVERVAV